ncbi:MAG: UDP-N-acetylglucosamine 2-epimerase [Bacteroidetes bacterium]|nr:UDP-N-acetylglucosamine 2-epimerase [Bacteroidota bacterium]
MAGVPTLNILNVVGARPNFMKVAPLMRAYREYPDRIKATLVHTGQHYDDLMSSIFFSQLGIPRPDVSLGVGSGSHAQQTAEVMKSFEAVATQQRPDLVLVVGDVNSTLAASIVAAKLNIPIAHVEAGLRSNDRTMPEEINRIVTDSLADFLFTTSRDADTNLLNEGVAPTKIHFVGNTMIDTLNMMKPLLQSSTILNDLLLGGNPYAFMTLHRPSNVDDRPILTGICEALLVLQQQIRIVWPLHPRTRKMLEAFGLMEVLKQAENISLSDPISYLDSLCLMSGARFVLTDSGGIQEETTVLGVPCLTLRENTERPVTVQEGTNELIGNKKAVLLEKATRLLSDPKKKGRIPELWDGRSSERIVRVLLQSHT